MNSRVFNVLFLCTGNLWPGKPLTAHWGVADPVGFEGSKEQQCRFFHKIYRELETRIKLFTLLPV